MFNGLSTTWPWNPWAIAVLALLSLFYLFGLRHVAKQHGLPVSPLRILSFFSAIVISALLLLTPIETIARTQLFSMHMTQVVILTTLCTPLIMYACPEQVLRPLVETPLVRDVIRGLIHPLVASIVFNLTFLLWHAPRLFAFAQQHEAVYHLMMLSIFLFSFLNWHPLIGALHKSWHMSYPVQMAYAFFDGQPVDIFAFVLVFTGVSIYPLYVLPAQMNLGAFSDQAVGGALLLIPGLVDFGVMTPLFFRWLAQIEERTRIADVQRQQELEEEEEWEEEEEEVKEPSER